MNVLYVKVKIDKKHVYITGKKMYMNVFDICIFYIKTLFENRRPATVWCTSERARPDSG